MDTIKEEDIEGKKPESLQKSTVKKEPVTTSKCLSTLPLSSKSEGNSPPEREVELKPVSGLPSSSRVTPQGKKPPYVSSPKTASPVSSPRVQSYQVPQQAPTRLPQSPVSQSSPQSTSPRLRSVSHQVSQPISHPAPQLPTQPTPQSTLQSTSKPITQSVSQSVSQPVSQPVSQSISQPISQPVSQPISQPVSQPVSQSVSQPMPVSTEKELRAKYINKSYKWIKNECQTRGLPSSETLNQLVNRLVNDDIKKSAGSLHTAPASPAPVPTSPSSPRGLPTVSSHTPSSPRAVATSSPVTASSPRKLSSSTPSAKLQEAEESRLQKLREEEEKRKQQLKTQTHTRPASPIRTGPSSPKVHTTSPSIQDRIHAFQKSTQMASRGPESQVNTSPASVLPNPVNRPMIPVGPTTTELSPGLPPKLEAAQSPRLPPSPNSQQRPASPRLPAAATQPTAIPDDEMCE